MPNAERQTAEMLQIANLRARVAELEASDYVDRVIASERDRIWNALKQKWHGDMGQAYIFVTDLETALNR